MNSQDMLVQTAAGIEPLARGIIYAHEHLWIDLTSRGDVAGKLDRYEAIVEELRGLKALGVAAVIEQTCLGMGRDMMRLRAMQQATGVQIIPATGYYHRGFHPPELASASVDKIVEMLAVELEEGTDGTNVRPMVLGEIGGSGHPLHADEARVFQAIARLAQRYPVLVTTHAHLGSGGLDELQLLREGGLEAQRILIGHLDLCPDLAEVISIAREGAYVGFDTVGKKRYASDERRVHYLKALLEAGLLERVLLSCDISRNPYLVCNGGQGYAYLLRVFLPMLRAAGIPEAAIQQVLEENPRRFLSGAGLSLAIEQ